MGKGRRVIEAAISGLIRYRTGSTLIVYRVSICSEMRRIPISAAMPEQARAVTMMAVSTGPISLTRERDTADPRAPTEPNFTRV
jgi:hypothetical protein